MDGRPVSPVVLTILDGWGYAREDRHNAIRAAETPVMDALWHAYPHTLIEASGGSVGLPDHQMGNSEVGHLTIGSGRIIVFDGYGQVTDGDGNALTEPAQIAVESGDTRWTVEVDPETGEASLP